VTPGVLSYVLTGVSVGAAIASACFARKANQISIEVTEREAKTDIRVRAIQNPGAPPSWWWAITNVSYAAIVDVHAHAGRDMKDLEKESTTRGYGMIIPAQPGSPEYTGSGPHWDADALGPFVTAHFFLSSDVVPDDGQDTYLRVWWTEIRGEQDNEHKITFRLWCKRCPTSGRITYGKEELARTTKPKAK